MIVKLEKLLRIKSNPYTEKDGEQFKVEIVSRLFKEVEDVSALGLSAPQIGIYKNIFIAFDVNKKDWWVAVNPKIHGFSKEMCNFYEGCLSFPGRYLITDRSYEIDFEDDIGGRRNINGINAVIIQHETNHLHGKLFFDFKTKIKNEGDLNLLTMPEEKEL